MYIDNGSGGVGASQQDSFDLFIKLTPPDAQAAGAFANVDGATFANESPAAAAAGYTPDQDTISSFAGGVSATTEGNAYNIGNQLGVGLAGAKAAIQHQLDNLNPDDPQVPILENYIKLCDQALTDPSVKASVQIGINKDTGNLDFIEVSSGKKASASESLTVSVAKNTAAGKSNWFGPSAYISFQNAFSDLLMLTLKMMSSESQFELKSMQMGFALAQGSSQAILDSANDKAKALQTSGICAAVSGGVALAGASVSIGATLKASPPVDELGEVGQFNNLDKPIYEKNPDGSVATKLQSVHNPDGSPQFNLDANGQPDVNNPVMKEAPIINGFEQYPKKPTLDANGQEIAGQERPIIRSGKEVEARNQKLQGINSAATALTQASSSITKAGDDLYNSKMTAAAGAADALKAMLDYYQKSQETITQKSMEQFKANQDYISGLLQLMDSIADKRQQMDSASLQAR